MSNIARKFGIFTDLSYRLEEGSYVVTIPLGGLLASIEVRLSNPLTKILTSKSEVERLTYFRIVAGSCTKINGAFAGLSFESTLELLAEFQAMSTDIERTGKELLRRQNGVVVRGIRRR